MNKDLCLVEVLMINYKVGDIESRNYFYTELDIVDSGWEDCIEDVPINPDHPYLDQIRITKNVTGFIFNFMGENFDQGYSNHLEWEVSEMGHEYVFADWVEELKKMGNKILEDTSEVKNIGTKVVRFVTLWEYECWKDSYYQEFESEWKLLGRVNLAKVEVEND